MAPSGITSMKVRSKPRPCAQSTQRARLAVVEPLERHGVDLDPETRLDRGVDALEHHAEIAPARDGAELVRVQRVERDIDPPDAAIGELMGEARELRAVGRQRHFVERAALEMAPEAAEQRHHVAPHQRLAAGDADLARAEADEGRAQPVQLLERQHVALGQEIHVLGHAVDAAKVAPIRHGHPHIGDLPAERIDQRTRRAGEVRSSAKHKARDCPKERRPPHAKRQAPVKRRVSA